MQSSSRQSHSNSRVTPRRARQNHHGRSSQTSTTSQTMLSSLLYSAQVNDSQTKPLGLLYSTQSHRQPGCIAQQRLQASFGRPRATSLQRRKDDHHQHSRIKGSHTPSSSQMLEPQKSIIAHHRFVKLSAALKPQTSARFKRNMQPTRTRCIVGIRRRFYKRKEHDSTHQPKRKSK